MMTTKFKLTINLLLVFLVLLDVILSTLCLFFSGNLVSAPSRRPLH